MSDYVTGMSNKLRCWAFILSCEKGKENALKEIGECADYFDYLCDLITDTHRAIATGGKKERLALVDKLWDARQQLITYKGTDEKRIMEQKKKENGLEESEDTTQKTSTYIGNFDVEAVRELFFSDEYYDVLKKI